MREYYGYAVLMQITEIHDSLQLEKVEQISFMIKRAPCNIQ
ncbi:hypothetical protein GARC_4089 [Paraglaciecola arctica BSs20135]|uniref:Uncharacterized protein n=1 Tax=Paraglaciecola arctica BSs20135 TaxID=493475 RepID=K6YAP8_9ALTE|nr:hypothetical protein GARC_4089 [Paraglaciecola arctica BSs20135]